jgi:hypothetical protein
MSSVQSTPLFDNPLLKALNQGFTLANITFIPTSSTSSTSQNPPSQSPCPIYRTPNAFNSTWNTLSLEGPL